MRAAESRACAINALRFTHQHSSGEWCGYAFATLRRIAGMPDLPLPHFVGPRRREHQAAYADAADRVLPEIEVAS